MRPSPILEASLAAHRRLEDALLAVQDEDCRGASLLPGWSRGHVLTHLADKTKHHVWMLEGAVQNQVRRPDYEHAPVEVEAGAGRSAKELRRDIMLAFAALEQAWNGLPDDSWTRCGVAVPGLRSMADLAGRHLRDVEVHHVDLDIGYGAADWSAAFIDNELPKRLTGLSNRTSPASLLAWLIGRGAPPELGPW